MKKNVALANILILMSAVLASCGGGGESGTTGAENSLIGGGGYSISGQVKYGALAAPVGLEASILNNKTGFTEFVRTSTDSTGRYKFENLSPGAYTLSLWGHNNGWTFNPASGHEVTITDTSINNLDFTASAIFPIPSNWTYQECQGNPIPLMFLSDKTFKTSPTSNYMAGTWTQTESTIKFVDNNKGWSFTGTLSGNSMSGQLTNLNTGGKNCWSATFINFVWE